MSAILSMSLGGVKALDASAGTGKTYSIALIYLRLVLAGMPVERILVTTFTDAAAAELRERLRKRLAEARDALKGKSEFSRELAEVFPQGTPATNAERRTLIENALSSFDLAPICTIHGFCQRLIRERGLELGVSDASTISATDPALARLIGDFMARQSLAADGEFADEADLKKIAKAWRDYAPGFSASTEVAGVSIAQGQSAERLMQSLWTAIRSAWQGQRTDVEAELKRLVLRGVLQPGYLDNPKATKEDQQFAKLATSIADAEVIIQAGELPASLSAGSKRLDRNELAKNVATGCETDLREALDRCSFFALWSLLLKPAKTAQLQVSRNFLGALQQLKPGQHRIFADLINAVYDKLGDSEFTAEVRACFDATLVDESQDTDARQVAIFRKLFADTSWKAESGSPGCLVWVGDPKQSIYRFRGADSETYQEAKAGAGQTLTLDENYRSDPPLVAAVNAVFSAQADCFKKISFTPVKAAKTIRIKVGDQIPPAFCLHSWSTGEDALAKTHRTPMVLRDAAESIEKLLASGMEVDGKPIHAGHIAVLTSAGRDLESVRRELTRRGIPTTMKSGVSVYASEEARDIGMLLRAMARPGAGAVRAVLATPLFGFALHALDRMDDETLARHQEQITLLATRLETEGFLSVLFALLRERPEGSSAAPALERLAALRDGERVITNYIQLGELLHLAWRDRHTRGAGALKEFLDQAMARSKAALEEDEQEAAIRLETDAPAVFLTTIHSAKGLEFPIVFLPMLWTQPEIKIEKYPCLIRHREGKAEMVLPGDPNWDAEWEIERQALAAEQMRLLYVALTRACHQVHVWWGRASEKMSAFGQLMCGEKSPATDAELVECFQSVMERGRPEATCEIVKMAEKSAGPVGGVAQPSASATTLPAESQPLPWSRSRLAAAPLQSSYSALLRKSPENHRGDDESSVATSPDDGSAGDQEVVEKVDDVLDPLQGGKVLGDRIHCAFERAMDCADEGSAKVAFGAALLPDLPGLVRDKGVKPDLAGIADAVWDRTAGAKLGGPFCVRDLFGGPRAAEWEFLLPQHDGLTPDALADAIQNAGAGSPWTPEYAEQVRALGFTPLRGYFEGIVDLVGQLPDKSWVVADYKTNRLDRYAPRFVDTAMADCHYLLQALLYAVAVNRWLERTKGWTYENNFCGVAYLFLRGLKAGSSQGVWFQKPPPALVRAVDALFTSAKERDV